MNIDGAISSVSKQFNFLIGIVVTFGNAGFIETSESLVMFKEK
ncbi:MAG: hypothetical protein OEL83_18920 [Desulforhopalus sp.]|nr:hypothetical protein [Desulforhopalus sp.]